MPSIFCTHFLTEEVSSIGNRIKGITVAINGDTTKLQTALKQVNGNIRNTQSQLKDVERLLRLDPTNTELLAQKQRLLKQAVSDTKDKLATLKKASEEAAKTKDKYDAWKAKYDPIKKKIEETTDKLKKLKEKSAEMEKAGKIDTTAYQTLQRKIEETSADLTALRQDAKTVTDEFGHPISPQQYDALQREIIETERDLESLQTQALQTSTAIDSIAATGEKMKTVGANMKTAGQKMLPVTLAVTAVGTAAVKTSADFEASMSKVAAISGATGDDLEALTTKAREMGSKTKFSASEAADGLTYMAMAGWSPQQMLEGLDGIMNLAAASGEELATTSDIVTDALTAFGLEAEDSSHFADVLAAASSNANTNVGMMGETFKYVAPVAGALGYSVEDTATAIGVLANNGIKSSQAGTVLRKTINSLVAPSKKATGQMQKLGFYASETIDTFDQQKIDEQMLKVQKASNAAEKAQLSYNTAVAKYGEDSAQAEAALNTYSIKQQELAIAEKKLDALKKGEVTTVYTYNKAIQNEDGSLKSFSETIEFLRKNLNGLSDAEKTAAVSQIFGAQASAGVLAILKTSDKDYAKLTSAINNCDGITQKMANTMQDNLSGQLTILKSQLQELAISFGEVLLPKIKKLVSWLQGVVDKLNKMTPKTRGLISIIALLVASIGPLLIVIGSLIGMVGSAIVNFKKLHGFIKGFPAVITKLSGVFSNAGAAISGISAPVLIAVAAIGVLVAAFVHLWKTNNEFRNKITAIWDSIAEKVKTFAEAVKERLGSLGIDFTEIVEVLQNVWSAFCNFLAPIFEGTFQLIADALSVVLDVILGLLDIFIGIFNGNWEQAWNGVKTIFISIRDFIISPTLWNSIKTGVVKAIKNIGMALFTVWNNIKNGITNTINGIKESIINGFRSAVEYVHDLIFQARSWGSDMIQNIINGLHDNLQDLADGVINVANTIREYLHFSVPDKGPLTDYQKWMPDFMQGMAQGIERSRGLIQEAISHVSSDMIITPTATAALIGGGSMAAAVSNTTTNNSNVTYNFNQTNNSPKSLSRFDIYRQSKNLLSGVKR